MNHVDLDVARGRHLQQRLHDGLGQCLSLAAMQIDQATAVPEAETLRCARALLREALQELRALISSIDQPPVDQIEPDLPGRLDACVRRLNALQAIPVSCTIEGPPLHLSPQACEVLLGATRELLVNACKHGEAVGIDARLSILPNRLSITVTERCSATGHARRPAPAPGQGSGLRSTRQGLSQIGARLRWRNSGPGGVQARISWVPPQ
jgi:signal transduction histidine kinase